MPLPVDVDGSLTENSAPDVLVQLTIDAGRATLRVTTLQTAPNPLPLEVEAIIADPRGSTNLKVAFGYDAREDTAPQVFSSTVQLVGASRVTSVALDMQTASPGSTLTVMGSVFELGPHGERVDPQSGSIRYEPVPNAAHFGVPNLVSLVLTTRSDGGKTWSYQTSDRDARINLEPIDMTADAVDDDFVIGLQDMTPHAVLVQDTPTHATLTTDSAIGVITVGSSNGRSIAWLDEPAYLYSTNRGAGDSFAFQIRGLSHAEYDTGDPFLVDVNVAAGPFHVLIEDGTRTTDAHIVDLPQHVRVSVSQTAGTLDYSGSAPIAHLTLDVNDPAGVSGRATHLSLALDGVPTTLSLAFGENGGHAKLDAGTAQIDKVRLLLTSGPNLDVDDGFDGVVLEDVPDHYALAARATGLTLADVTTGDAPYGVKLKKQAGPFLVSLEQGTRHLRVEVHDLPDSIDASIDPAGHVSYSASAPIRLITAVASDPRGIAGRATQLSLRVEDVPASLTLDFGTAGSASVDAHGARIGLIDLLATSGPTVTIPTGTDGFIFEDVPDHYAFAVHITGLRLANVSTAAPYTVDLRKDAGPFFVGITQGARITNVSINDLPDSLQATIDPRGSLSYTASAAIGRVYATVADPGGVTGRATYLQLEVRNLPTSLTLDFTSSSNPSIDAHGARIGLIDLLATSGPSLSLPSGFDGIMLRDTPADYILAVHLNGLRKAAVSSTSP
ncbi:MAG: hypothetical protein LC663_02960, partial [Actinobacteria bacterium]|nr:hypothetical protein [Actinomycetota bacterium]